MSAAETGAEHRKQRLHVAANVRASSKRSGGTVIRTSALGSGLA
jgi:hypothetical protein